MSSAPLRSGDLPLAAYALASAAYRWLVILGLVWKLLPRYLGVGLLIGIWGGIVILLAPMQAAFRSAPATPESGGEARSLRRWRIPALLAVFLGALMFLPVAPREVIDVSPDTTGVYALAVSRAGLKLDEARVAAQVSAGAGAAGVQRGSDQVTAAQQGLRIAETDQAALTLRAAVPGRFIASETLVPGLWLQPGAVVGSFLPDGDETMMTGAFPETSVESWDLGVTRVTLRSDGRFIDIEPTRARLVEEINAGTMTTKRSLTLRLTVPGSPADVISAGQQVRIDFAPIPVWRHVAGWARGKIAQFRDAEIAERHRRLDNNEG